MAFKGAFTNLKRRPEDFILVLFAALLIIIVIAIIVSVLRPLPTGSTTPSPTPVVPTPAEKSRFILLDKKGGEDLAEKLINRKKLSEQDSRIKDTMLTTYLKGKNSGILYRSELVQVEYIKSLDLIVAEILTPQIREAKTDANTWLTKQGFSQQAICDLPVLFFLSHEAIENNQARDILFRPLPPGC